MLRAAALAAALAAAASPAPAQDAAVPPKAQPCVACHGVGGNSTTPSVPSLAGQPRQFLVTQLYLFREGNRKDAQMSPMAAGLSNADMNQLAAYFSGQKLQVTGKPMEPDKAAVAKKVSDQFNCTQCHGATLLGQQHIPRLAGQHADYLRRQLTGFKATTRFDMDGQMTSAAQALTPADIELLSVYMAGLGN